MITRLQINFFLNFLRKVTEQGWVVWKFVCALAIVTEKQDLEQNGEQKFQLAETASHF